MTWLSGSLDLILELTLEHLWLSLLPIVAGFVIAIPLGQIAWRQKWLRGPMLSLVGLLYTIPSLALFVLLPPLLGIGFLSRANLIVALTIYAVALMTRFASDAFASVDIQVRQAAVAMGYDGWRRFWAVDLPLAGPVLLAGLRVVAVSTVSLVTVGVLVGIRSLGFLFTDGLQRNIPVEILTGIVMTVVTALVLDGLLVLLGRRLMPWSRKPRSQGRTGAEVAR
ncbi:ABC transporter permease [Ruania alba]|uniref:Osmoprotectant transport system permease protein n=1 Tax=Ruania alba TaxID=648782 RepID=A0A1H5DVP2_9MICO|nr:ABC transporter permease [Ruania alba]SED82937.1 osmoprotectant transport system permease protein [Ruania alba]